MIMCYSLNCANDNFQKNLISTYIRLIYTQSAVIVQFGQDTGLPCIVYIIRGQPVTRDSILYNRQGGNSNPGDRTYFRNSYTRIRLRVNIPQMIIMRVVRPLKRWNNHIADIVVKSLVIGIFQQAVWRNQKVVLQLSLCLPKFQLYYVK